MFKKNTTQCILGLSYDNLIWSPKKTKVCGRTSPLLQLWDSFGFWHTSICSPQIITSHPKKKSWNDRNGAAPRENAGRLKSSHALEKERKTSPSFIQLFGLFGVQLLLCFQTCVWSTDIHWNSNYRQTTKGKPKKEVQHEKHISKRPKKM